jgi:hypothetical protein
MTDLRGVALFFALTGQAPRALPQVVAGENND